MTDACIATLDSLLEEELHTGAPESPFRPAVLRWAVSHDLPTDPGAYLAVLEGNRIGGRGGARRYRWSFPHGEWVPLEHRVRWRPAEAELAERHANEHANRLWTPIVLVEHIDWLDDLTRHEDRALAARAAKLLAEAAPTLEDDVARHVLGADAWADTFLLWIFSRRPRAMGTVRGLMTAVASRYALRAKRANGLVVGRSFPFSRSR